MVDREESPLFLVTKELPAYQYEDELTHGEIRLLKLLSIEQGGIAYFELRKARLPSPGDESSTPYIALSYVWGDESNKMPIVVNGGRVMVTQNLYAALAFLGPELQESEIWIDAVCINQDDETNGNEKVNQIAQMGEVYRNASMVYVFLGLQHSKSDIAMQNIRRIGQDALEAGIEALTERHLAKWPSFEGLGEEDRRAATVVREKLDVLMQSQLGGVFNRPKIDIWAINQLLHRIWFSRAWVVQELAVPAPGKVTLACGTERVSWEQIWAATLFLSLLIRRQLQPMLSSPTWLPTFLVLPFRAFLLLGYWFRTGTSPEMPNVRASTTLGIRKKYLRGQLDRSLKNLLTTLYVADVAHPLACRDPEDKIGAILALVRSEDNCWLAPLIRKTQPWRDLYTAMARRLIHDGFVDFISLSKHDDLELPSWVPDWRHPIRQPWSGLQMSDQGSEEQLFCAAGGTRAMVSDDDPTSRTLSLSGYHVDVIEKIGSKWVSAVDQDFDWKAAQILHQQIEEFLLQSTMYDEAAKSDGMWKIPIGDKELGDLGFAQRATELSRSASLKMKEAFLNRKPGIAYMDPGAASYMNMMNYMHESRPFISKKGYVGLCPSKAGRGDVIFVPCGARVPYVVHRLSPSSAAQVNETSTQTTSDDWKLLGEAFVYGIMDNELRLEEHGDSVQPFRLC